MNNLRFSSFLALVLWGLLSTQAYASFDISVYGGGVGVQTSKSKVYFSPQETDVLYGSNESTEFTYGAGVAYTYHLTLPSDSLDTYPFESFSLGFDIYTFSASRDGTDLLFGSPNFANYLYDMDISSTRLMLDGQINSQPFWLGIRLFAQAGAGVTRNTLNYHETPLPGIQGTGLHLSGNTNYQFAYDFGGGLKLPLADCLEISARYLYSNLGNAESSTQGNNTILEPIKVKLRSQSVLLGVTYLIN